LPKERIGEHVYVFYSDLYAQVTATVIVASRQVVIVDTLLYPSEGEEVAEFATRGSAEVRYVINTHGHLDHVANNYLFPDAEIIAHSEVRRAMAGPLQRSLEQAQEAFPALRRARLRFPTITSTSEVTIRLPNLTLQLIPLPGHSHDAYGVYIVDEKILVAGDAVLPVPHFVGSDPDLLIDSLKRILTMNLNTIVQGHGDVILKGEVEEAIQDRIAYVQEVKKLVSQSVAAGLSLDELLHSGIEAFGGSRQDLDGLTQQLHEDNLTYLYNRLTASQSNGSLTPTPQAHV